MTKKEKPSKEIALVTLDVVRRRIHFIRGQNVMLDSDLAALYGVTTFRLNEAVKRNKSRFPEDFMYQLTKEENETLISQIAMSKSGRGGRRTMPFVFTEQGVAMLSSVLNSERAVQVNIAIMRTFVNMRRLMLTNEAVRKKLALIEHKIVAHDGSFKEVFAALRALMTAEKRADTPIGFIRGKKIKKRN